MDKNQKARLLLKKIIVASDNNQEQFAKSTGRSGQSVSNTVKRAKRISYDQLWDILTIASNVAWFDLKGVINEIDHGRLDGVNIPTGKKQTQK